MKISLISDCHFEFYTDPKLFINKSNVDVLVIAGDLAVGKESIISALKKFSPNFKDIIYVLGNHESYGSDYLEVTSYISRLTRNSNIHFLNPGSITIGNVCFLGGCLWTDFRKDAMAKFMCARNINDFNRIKGFDTDACAALHTEHIKYIKEGYAAHSPLKKVIVTHFLPAIECISPQYRNSKDLINYYFANDYGDWISDLKDTTCLFGHTHDNVDITIGYTRCIANPYGYNANPNYKEMIIEV